MKRFLTLLIGLLATAAVVTAKAESADNAAHPAQVLVKSTAETLLKRLRAEHDELMANPDRVYPLVQDVVLPHFDFRKMSQWVLGKHWRGATPEQRDRFTEQFRNLLVRTYATALLEYDDQTLRYLPVHAEEGARRVTVKTEVVQAGGPPIPINYAMYQRRDGEWKVYDIAIDGASMISTYRKSYYSQIRKEGLDALIERLHEMNAKVNKSE